MDQYQNIHHGAANIASSMVISANLAPSNHVKRRGSYNCGRCGEPKKGHSCLVPSSISIPAGSGLPPRIPVPAQKTPNPPVNLRRALTFNEPGFLDMLDRLMNDEDLEENSLEKVGLDLEPGVLPPTCLWNVFKRLQPAGLYSVGRVCRGWREASLCIWKEAEKIRIRIPRNGQVGYLGSVLKKCPGLVALSLQMDSDLDATMLACIAFSCPNLEALEISMYGGSINWINGDELGRFVAEKRCLSSLKLEGCGNLGGFSLCSSRLSTLWLSGFHFLSKMVINCPNLKELSLGFSPQGNYFVDLAAMVYGLGKSCSKLIKLHIASVQLSQAVVFALTSANFRGLKMLSLVQGSEITDASVADIVSTYSALELLDLSGSSISDSGIGIICNFFAGTLSSLLLAACPNITSSGLQFAIAQLPLLKVMDCGSSICDFDSEASISDRNDNNSAHTIYQKLIIKHDKLKELSLWGCSGLDALNLNCANLDVLNLNACSNLHPEKLQLHCPKLEKVHASGCQDKLTAAILIQIQNGFHAREYQLPCKRNSSGSKRILASNFHTQGPCGGDNKRRKLAKQECKVIVD